MSEFAPSIPLVVDLDGTLIRTDLLYESTLKFIHETPIKLFALPVWLAQGKAVLKHKIAERVSLDVSKLPYDMTVIAWLRKERQSGRHIVLCTASDHKYADAVAEELGLIDEVIATDGITNMSADNKAQALVDRFGEKGFDYAANSHDDVPVWARSRSAILIAANPKVCSAARSVAPVTKKIDRDRGGIIQWVKALRIHQWSKNVLVFLPLIGAHEAFNRPLLINALVAFLAFGMCASSVYLLNDLMDLDSDRSHPRKRRRPFASGALSPLAGVVAAGLLLAASFALASTVRPAFVLWLGAYLFGTMCYTFSLKTKVLMDVIALAGLYSLRIIAGGAAVGMAVSFWLLALSLFLFLSLAFVKRYSELRLTATNGNDGVSGRGYRATDLPLVEVLGVVAGFMAVLVMALYINGETIARLYRHPEIMWLTIPILLYWINRMWIKAHRGEMDDDPLVYAMRDRVSLVSAALFITVMWIATLEW
ncbi:MAG: UbiA prenyltransferase [Herminiimonas sp.]|nr:UbiA prenyltransferase [Herminiimonas sp.]